MVCSRKFELVHLLLTCLFVASFLCLFGYLLRGGFSERRHSLPAPQRTLLQRQRGHSLLQLVKQRPLRSEEMDLWKLFIILAVIFFFIASVCFFMQQQDQHGYEESPTADRDLPVPTWDSSSPLNFYPSSSNSGSGSSIRHSVRSSGRNSLRNSLRNSDRNSVTNSVRNSVDDSNSYYSDYDRDLGGWVVPEIPDMNNNWVVPEIPLNLNNRRIQRETGV